MSHTCAGITSYKKASPKTTVKVADGNILPADGFGTIEVDLDQLSSTTKPMRMVTVAYVPGHRRKLLSTLKVMGEWSKPLNYYRTKDVLR